MYSSVRYTLCMTECREWPAGKWAHGYGRIGQTGYAHRFIYELIHGPIPEGMEVRHTCDNPPCVNPEHLVLGTHAENMRDIAERDRWRNQYRVPDSCRAGHDLTLRENVSIRPSGRWQCLPCGRKHSQAYRKRNA